MTTNSARGRAYPGLILGRIAALAVLLCAPPDLLPPTIRFIGLPAAILVCLAAFLQSRNAGHRNYSALAGLIVGAVLIVLPTAVVVATVFATPIGS